MSYATLDSVFSALGDPTRRQIVERLARGRQSITEVAAGIPMSQPAISKHVKVLEESGLIRRRIEGRVHQLELTPKTMDAAASWIETQRKFWNAALDRLAAYLSETAPTAKERKKK
ncbi:MAG: winged helix-turn-helix transcriptional regulator [Candidatus Eremiobacteraeota bacterium]|nr:winged helix-turn-helix transcriptional regulator [Candidatus Eremiobacteraeota bacterium]